MSGRMEEWITNPGYGSGHEIVPHLYRDEGRGIAAMNPRSRHIQQHAFYNEEDFKRDALAYARHTREYMTDLEYTKMPPVWQVPFETLEELYPEKMSFYEQKMHQYNSLEKEYRVLLEKSRHIPRERVMFNIIQPIRPVRPVLPTEEDELPPPPLLQRSHNVDWWDQWLAYQGKKSSKSGKSGKSGSVRSLRKYKSSLRNIQSDRNVQNALKIQSAHRNTARKKHSKHSKKNSAIQ